MRRLESRSCWYGALLTAAFACALFAGHSLAEGPRKVRKDLKVEDFGTILRARTVTAPILYREMKSGQMHFLCVLEACNGLTAADGMLGEETPFQIYDLNLDTAEARYVTARSGRTGAPFVHSGGKMYFCTTRPPALVEYDPALGKAREIGLMQKDNYYAGAQSFVEGPDRRIYYGMYGLHVVAYDPATEKIEDFGDITNGKFKGGYVYFIGVDDRYVHGDLKAGASGYAVYDLRAKKSVWFTPEEYNAGIKTGAWKSEGRPVFADDPPKKVAWSPYRALGRDAWSVDEAKAAGVEVDIADIRPTDWNGGVVTVKWRKAGEGEWRVSKTRGADLMPNSVKRLTPMPDGKKLIGMSAFYGIIFTFDPETGEKVMLGPSPGSVYDMLSAGGKVYFSGYSTQFAAYDPSKPWTYPKSQHPEAKEENPDAFNGGGKYNYFMAAGGDGRVYFAGTHSRHSTGASLDCYDPAKPGKSAQLVRQELLEHFPSDLVAINGGRILIMGYGRQLVVYDVDKQQLAPRVDLPEGLENAGKFLDAGPDEVMGLVRTSKAAAEGGKVEHGGLLYKVNIRTGKVLYLKTIPGRAFSGQLTIEFKGEDARFARGPDGCGWLFIDKWLSRINPADGSVEKFMEMDNRGRMFFLGDDLYVYNGGRQYFGGFAGILRLRNVFE